MNERKNNKQKSFIAKVYLKTQMFLYSNEIRITILA